MKGGVAEHVLQELLANEHRPHQRAKHDDPGAGRHPEDAPPGDVEVVQRVGHAARPDQEGDPRGDRDHRQPEDQRTLVGHGGEVDRQDQRRHQQRREHTAEVVDRVGGLVMWADTKASAISRATTASGKVIRNTDPHQNDSSSQPDSSGPSEAMAPPVPDHNAIDRVRPGPDHNAVISASVVGKAMPAENPPSSRATMRTPSEGA
jgi:hypothetical protein